MHPPLEGRPWWGECFLWFVSFAPKEMNNPLLVLSEKNTPHQNITQTSLQQPSNQQSATAQTDAQPVDSGNPDNKHAPRHQRSRLLFYHPCIGRPLVRDSNLDPSARALLAYMSEASLKKGSGCFYRLRWTLVD